MSNTDNTENPETTESTTATPAGTRKGRRTRGARTPREVTIRGRISTTYLRAGETTTVTLTDRLRDFHAAGYITILDEE